MGGGGYRLPGQLGIYDEQEAVCRLPDTDLPVHSRTGSGPLSSHRNRQGQEVELLRKSLVALGVEAHLFGFRFINDNKVRLHYLAEIKHYSNEALADVYAGLLSVEEAHLDVHRTRGTILEASRLSNSEVGRAWAESKKLGNKPLEALYQEHATALFKKPYELLDAAQSNEVQLKIIESAGHDRPTATRTASRFGKLGVGLWVLTIGIAAYEVATAKDKIKESAHQGALLSGSILGGAATGAATGLVCGPGAPVCSGILVIAGGALGALGMEHVFNWVWE